MSNVTDARSLGPSPVRPVSGVELGPTRARILGMLVDATDPVTIRQVATTLGTHANSARAHLDGLVEDGLVSRQVQQTGQRGRPRYEYSVTDAGRGAHVSQGQQDALTLEYHGLLSAFAAHIDSFATRPGSVAREVGERWGRTLAAGDDSPAREQVIVLLRRLGFSPTEPDGDGGDAGDAGDAGDLVELRTCPLLDLAVEHPEVICNVHVGLVEGALEAAGGDTEGVVLRPFAAPGACHLTVP